MGLLQKAVETYDCHAHLAGRIREGHTPLPPMSHTLTSAQLEITLNREGKFVTARLVDKDEPKIIIPVTEASAGRTGKLPPPHPLCDNLAYIAPCFEERHSLYLDQLEDWASSGYSHPKLNPVLSYVKSGTVLSDLSSSGLIELEPNGAPKNEKLFVRWVIIGIDDDSSVNCWEDPTLFKAYTDYYAEKKRADGDTLCMISGKNSARATQHAKGIIPLNGNAKLISANDKSGFTFRGRFDKDRQAAEISYEASQKAHNALRWLAAEQGARAAFGGRTFLCWNPKGKPSPHVAGNLFGTFKKEVEPSEYKEALKKTLDGFKSQLDEKDDVIIAAFDAATTGRLAMTYYKELKGSDFLERLYSWDEHCSWNDYRYGCGSPPMWQIVNCAFGTESKGKLETDDRVMRQQAQRLLACRIDGAAFPGDIVRQLVHRASSPQAYDAKVREDILSTACAVIRKYRFDKYKEEWSMEYELHRDDRSFLFGCLLAVMEQAERLTYKRDESREPNAIRLQSVFCRRPFSTAKNIEEQLERAYFSRLKPGTRNYFKDLIGEILENIFSSTPKESLNSPLGETYLLGYYLQRNELRKHKTNDTEENENERTEE